MRQNRNLRIHVVIAATFQHECADKSAQVHVICCGPWSSNVIERASLRAHVEANRMIGCPCELARG
eukprot:1011273-Pyramimonas_sp.AAC.1